MTAKLTLSGLMLTDKQRRKELNNEDKGIFLCDGITCDDSEECRMCKAHERAAIANAVVVLDESKMLHHKWFYMEDCTEQGDCPSCALLAECRKVVKGE